MAGFFLGRLSATTSFAQLLCWPYALHGQMAEVLRAFAGPLGARRCVALVPAGDPHPHRATASDSRAPAELRGAIGGRPSLWFHPGRSQVQRRPKRTRHREVCRTKFCFEVSPSPSLGQVYWQGVGEKAVAWISMGFVLGIFVEEGTTIWEGRNLLAITTVFVCSRWGGVSF